MKIQTSRSMKKVTFLIAVILTISKLFSQSYEIGFTGTGASNSVDSVLVENLTLGTSLTLKGDDILQLSNIMGIHDHDLTLKSLKIYPNPMSVQAYVEFNLAKSSNIIITVYDVSGRIIIQSNDFLNQGTQKYQISGLQQGIYFVQISDQNSLQAIKLISQNNLLEEVNIEKVTFNDMTSKTNLKGIKSSTSTIVMDYNEGDLLKFMGMSGSYSTVITDVPTENNTIMFEFMDCTDADSNNYSVVEIGTQIWMVENLATTKYNDGSDIPLVTDDSTWLNSYTPGYCWYNNDQATYGYTFGALYNWYTVNTGKLCPTGWHVPTDDDWTTLTNYLGGKYSAGGKLKETDTTHWYNPNTEATNESGFTALPSGTRLTGGSFLNYRILIHLWSSTEHDTELNWSWERIISYNSSTVSRGISEKHQGSSVRCIKD
jgi:uncharacterized protein (TIGR02145 family)